MSKIVKFYVKAADRLPLTVMAAPSPASQPAMEEPGAVESSVLADLEARQSALEEACASLEVQLAEARERFESEQAARRDQMHQALEAEAASIRESAKAEGYEEGMARAEAQLAAMRQEAQLEAMCCMEDAKRAAKQFLDESEPYVVELALDIARRLLATELTTDPGQVNAIIRTALAEAGRVAEAEARVHPDDCPHVRVDAVRGSIERVVIVPDPAVARGGCVVVTPRGTVDAGLEQRIEVLRAALATAGGDPS